MTLDVGLGATILDVPLPEFVRVEPVLRQRADLRDAPELGRLEEIADLRVAEPVCVACLDQQVYCNRPSPAALLRPARENGRGPVVRDLNRALEHTERIR